MTLMFWLCYAMIATALTVGVAHGVRFVLRRNVAAYRPLLAWEIAHDMQEQPTPTYEPDIPRYEPGVPIFVPRNTSVHDLRSIYDMHAQMGMSQSPMNQGIDQQRQMEGLRNQRQDDALMNRDLSRFGA